MDDTVAIDATHFEARDRASSKEKKPKRNPKKRGRKPKAEREQWLKKQAEKEANLSIYQKKIEDQLDVSLAELRTEIPQEPKWGIKKNSEGKNEYWFGYKGHLAVSTTSQYILQSLFSSGNLNDGKAAIPLLKGIDERLSLPDLKYQTMDAGYDYEAIYQQVYRMEQQSIIAYNKRNEPEPIGFNKHFAPTCFREHSYRYDSYDGKAAIPLLKGIDERLSLPDLKYQTMDAGYDYEAIYQQVYRMEQQSIIAYNKRNEPEPIGFNKHFAPTCFREHSYRYDSYDA